MTSLIDKCSKFFALEKERNFDNRAVVGGLEKITPLINSEADSIGLQEEHVKEIVHILEQYEGMDIPGRKEALHTVLELLKPNAAPGDSIKLLDADADVSQHKPQQPSGNDVRSSSISEQNTIRRPDKSKTSEGLNAPVSVLPSIGPLNSQKLNTLGIQTLRDLLFYFPRRYDDYSQLKPINRLKYGEDVTIIATIQSIDTRQIKGGKLKVTEAVAGDGTGYIRLTWFNQPWIDGQLKRDDQVVIAGKIDLYLGRLTISSPEWEYLDQDHLHTNRIVPVYSLTSRITQKILRRIMYQTVGFWAPRVPDFLPESVISDVDVLPLSEALYNIHFPKNTELLSKAQTRLAFDEILLLQLGVLKQKLLWQKETARVFTVQHSWLQDQIAGLPYQLTKAQENALNMILKDLGAGFPMNRLLQGDVGSGKTIVAALGAAVVVKSGAQTAFMAPTSILADQHFNTLRKYLVEDSEMGINPPFEPDEIALLVGDTPEKDKMSIRSQLQEGRIKFIVGTHALLEDPIEFNDLQYIVIDEQHRFGVAQRAILRQKGTNPHLLVMTATPIPRSLALTLYGDLDITIMDEMPAGRKPVETHVLHPLERERAYQLIRTEVAKGYQAFIVYPLISQGENNDETKAAVEEHQRLQTDIFPNLSIGLLHGRMKPEEKDRIMIAFRDGEYQILVSTSVIEVGVDIPSATIMLIEGANRFGLAQLHQFRGRVGRNDAQSYCLLIPQSEDALENERLMVMADTNDGFVLAEKDLEQRGPGDFLGTRQAGFAELKMAKLTDIRLIEKARNQAQKIFDRDPNLTHPENGDLAHMVDQFWSDGKGDIS
ncbi:MAG: ATP-dependent DNA helicase RecG [Anaerolineae bacterium]|nr:ATP-dependent DNA helicase RecG [Anaerolineae bacterium]